MKKKTRKAEKSTERGRKGEDEDDFGKWRERRFRKGNCDG